MKTLSILFKVLGHIWMGIFAIVFVLSIIGMFRAEPSLYHGWKRVSETLVHSTSATGLSPLFAFSPELVFTRPVSTLGTKLSERLAPFSLSVHS